MLKVALLILIAISIPLSAFAESMIELSTSQTNIKPLDSVLVVGKISDISNFKPVKLTVIAPDGEIVYSPDLPIDNNGEFKRLIHPTLPSFKEGVYTVIASHNDTQKTAQVQFTVIGTAHSGQNEGDLSTGSQEPEITTGKSLITLSAETNFGDNKIIVTGSTPIKTDITFTASAPNGKLVFVAQITPQSDGKFSTEIKTGGPLWVEDGMYTITVNQGTSSQYKQSLQVEVTNGAVVPEFGTITVMILAVAIISIVILSSKSRLSITPRY
jgi:predicted secreted protein with PEFG-CTERM motif